MEVCMKPLLSEYNREQVDVFWQEYWRTDWPDLGFYYRRNPNVPAWEFFADHHGYACLAQVLQQYAQGLGRIMGEHDHIVPDWTLTLSTAPTHFINARGIYGSEAHFMALAELITTAVSDLKNGQMWILSPTVTSESDHALHLHVMEAVFLTG